MKEVETLQDLPTPAPQDLGLHHFKALQITIQRDQKQIFVKLKDNIASYHRWRAEIVMTVTKKSISCINVNYVNMLQSV